MKKSNLLILAGVLTLITSCAGIEKVYKEGEFHTQVFEDNYYRYTPAKYINGAYEETIIDVTDEVFLAQPFDNIFNTVILPDYTSRALSLETMVNNYGNQAAKELSIDDFNGNEIAYVGALMSALSASSSANYFNYAKYNNLSNGNFGESVNKAFKKGVFSKLTDGLILCDGSGSLVRIQIDENGIGQTFDHELITYRNLILSARGGTNLDFGAIGEARVRTSKVRINISFYTEKSSADIHSVAKKTTLTYVVDELQTDDSGTTTVMNIDLTEVLPAETLKRVSGMSVNYELLDHSLLKPGGVPSATIDGEYALMLYEVMFPNATWR